MIVVWNRIKKWRAPETIIAGDRVYTMPEGEMYFKDQNDEVRPIEVLNRARVLLDILDERDKIIEP